MPARENLNLFFLFPINSLTTGIQPHHPPTAQSIMKSPSSWALALLLSYITPTLAADDSDNGYIGYRLEQRGDPESAVYETANTDAGVPLDPIPDVYLNASVSVGHIGIEVDNITAKVNVDAKVLNLLHFNAGVDASIDRVKLTIENVSAKVELEARLGNVVAMVDDVLSSIDLNPIIATLGREVGDIVGDIGDTLGGGGGSSSSSASGTSTGTATSSSAAASSSGTAAANAKRELDYLLAHNILYSINDYQGMAHTNRILGQNGTIYDEFLDNAGNEHGRRVVGWYANDMAFNGHNRTIEVDGNAAEFELQYEYRPFPGIEVTSWIYVDAGTGKVARTQVIAEAHGGGTSTISNDSEA